ncbi:hypothetical protein BGW80DRAFT_1289450 [Lactifluus volemus]|nr:hypothetical protein BGW80DRAFT_1289450 [Lactifluus volemus]
MRLIHRVWQIANAVYLRITLNWVTLSFFALSFLYFSAQGLLQSFMYSADDAWGALTSDIVAHAQINWTVFAQYTGRHGTYSLELCNHGDPDPCVHFFTEGQSEPVTIPSRFLPSFDQRDASLQSSALWILGNSSPSQDLRISSQPRPDGSSDVVISSTVNNMSMTIDPVCSYTLLYPHAKLSQARREDQSLIAYQFWLFGLAVFALVFESIPHTLALVIARVTITGWSTYSLWRSMNIDDRLHHIIQDVDTPCHLDLFSGYFDKRIKLQIADLALHCTALFISIFLSWRLYLMYRTHTFSRVGPPKNVLRMYRYFLAVLVSIQLSLFVLVTALALWVDQLLHGPIRKFSSRTPVYGATFILTAVMLIPWLTMGWFSVRREWRKMTWAFLGTSCFFIFTWTMMFYSPVYRFTFIDWPFFGCVTVTAFVSLIFSTVFMFICRHNYGKGLAQWLYIEDAFGEDEFVADLIPTQVTETPHASKSLTLTLTLSHLDPFKDVEGMA